MNKKLLLVVKAVISLSLIGVLLFNVNWQEVWQKLALLNPWITMSAFSLMVLQFPISAWKWQRSLQIHNLEYGFGFLQKVLCIGFFFNNFLPTSIGGDGYRVIKTIPDEGYKSRAISAVLFERILGLAALVCIGFVGALFVVRDSSTELVPTYIGLFVVGAITGLMCLLLIKIGLLKPLQNWILKIKKIDILTHNLGHIVRNHKKTIEVVLISIFFQVIAVAVIYLLFAAVGITQLYVKCALIAAIVGIASMLPISINGLGLVEGAFVAVAIQLGIDYDQAVIVAFMMRILVLPISLVCGLIYLSDTKKPQTAMQSTTEP